MAPRCHRQNRTNPNKITHSEIKKCRGTPMVYSSLHNILIGHIKGDRISPELWASRGELAPPNIAFTNR